MEKNKKQQAIYDSLPSRYLEFREKITNNDKQTWCNYNNTNDTIITTIDLLIDDILDKK